MSPGIWGWERFICRSQRPWPLETTHVMLTGLFFDFFYIIMRIESIRLSKNWSTAWVRIIARRWPCLFLKELVKRWEIAHSPKLDYLVAGILSFRIPNFRETAEKYIYESLLRSSKDHWIDQLRKSPVYQFRETGNALARAQSAPISPTFPRYFASPNCRKYQARALRAWDKWIVLVHKRPARTIKQNIKELAKQDMAIYRDKSTHFHKGLVVTKWSNGDF